MRVDNEKINHLLDVDDFYGEHRGRLGPVLLFLTLGAIPPLIFIYFLYGKVPIAIFLIFYIPFLVRLGLRILGREKERLVYFKRALYDEFSSIADIIKVDTVHDNGCLEYNNGRICFCIIVENGTCLDSVAYTQALNQIISLLSTNESLVDIRIYNETNPDMIALKYRNANAFQDSEMAKDYISILEYNEKLVEASSIVTTTVLCVQGSKQDWKSILNNIESVLRTGAAKMFKDIHLASKDEMLNILSRDINTTVNLDLLQQIQFSTGDYDTSRIVGFDVSDDSVNEVKEDTVSFMPQFEEEQK